MNADRKKFFFYFLIIFVLNLSAYCPSFFDPPRSDQIVYLSNTFGQTDWYSLAVKNYAHTRLHHEFGYPPDESLFRPILYFILGTQKWAFGYNFLYWQLFSFTLHLIVLGLLLKLLFKIYPGRAAFFMTAFFSLMPANSDMVTWHHINAYLVATICLLIALDKILFSKSENALSWPATISICVMMTIASLTYEICVLFSLLFALYIATRGLKTIPKDKTTIGQGLTALLPVIIFASLDMIDLMSRGFKNMEQASSLLDFPHLVCGLKQTFHAVFWWLYTGAFMTQIQIFPYQRTMIFPYYTHSQNSFISYSIFGLLSVGVSSSLMIFFFYQLKKGFRAERIKQSWPMITLILGMLLIFILTISIGRLSSGELKFKLAENSYYGYFFWLFTFIACHLALASNTQEKFVASRTLNRTVSILCTAAITCNFFVTLDMNIRRSSQMMFQKRLLSATQDLVRQHAHEKDFSFKITDSVKDRVYADWIPRANDPFGPGHVYLKLLYPKFYSDEHPKYIYTAEQIFR